MEKVLRLKIKFKIFGQTAVGEFVQKSNIIKEAKI